MSFNKLATAVTAIGALVALSACGGSSESDGASSEITVMGYSALFEDQYKAAVIEKFEEEHPDLSINYIPAQNSAEMLGKLRSEASNPSIDVAILDTSVASTGISESLFEKLDEEKIPNLANVVELGRNADGYGPAVTFDNLTLLYNTENVDTPPKETTDLFDAPDDSVAIPAPPDIQGLALTILTAESMGVDFEQDVTPAVEELSKLTPKVTTWEPQPDVYQNVISGQSDYAIGWNARSQFYADDSDGVLGTVAPENGLVFQINTINAVKDSPAADQASEFIDYALSKEAQEAFAQQLFYAPTVENAEIPQDVSDRVVKADDPRIVDVDWTWMADERDGWTDQWRRQVIGG
ncbi:extracellular solute-binding protein [Brevibacterium luteolum]|uniref:extracellular solute-binding protein n=1 Tax=Brevibacterium luteolum TaxID=199591 RepID=UPI001C22C1E4|nr:extracellular solute-binding protein [Brevibacterium luteolum]MBU8579974.1 extracellular solute-binding protein [Brevibacterium luteolum]